jgi:hypothetical protein
MQNKLVCLICRKAKEALFLAPQHSKANNVLFLWVFGRALASESKAGWCERLATTVSLASLRHPPVLKNWRLTPTN